MFQTITAFRMQLQLWQAQVKTNNAMFFELLAKHSPANREKHVSMPSILIKEFENKFQECQKTIIYVCDTIISWYNYITCDFSNGVYGVAVQLKTLNTSLYWTFIRPPTKGKIYFASQPHLIHVTSICQYAHL